MFTTDLELSVTQIIGYYGARWKIESGEPLAKLSTGKFCKPISAPEKPFFEPGRARIAIFDSHPH
jgi:hypothetical protein